MSRPGSVSVPFDPMGVHAKYCGPDAPSPGMVVDATAERISRI